MSPVDENKLQDLVGKVLVDLGGAASVPLARLGRKHGLYRNLHVSGPATANELADRLGLAARYVREWLCAQAASGYVQFDPKTGRFSLSPEQVMVFVDEDSPVHLLPAFETAWCMAENFDKVSAAFESGQGVAWGDQPSNLFRAVARFFRPGYVNNLIDEWIPSLAGMHDRLIAGGRVADIGCGYGHSTVLMAQAYPQSHFMGYDFHEESILEARKHAQQWHLGKRVRFETAAVKDIADTDFDLVTCFDCLHDMGDPVGAAAHVKSILKPDGVWMIVEPMAADALEDNLNPVSRFYYAASTMICVPTSLSQEKGMALGAQAGEKALTAVIKAGGFRRVRRVAQTPFNMVLEARP